MNLRWSLLPLATLVILPSTRAHSATIAVMPAHCVNLDPGSCDAIGEVFSHAFARDARVAVVSAMEVKPIRAQAESAMAAAGMLGATHYIELSTIRLEGKVTLSGYLFGRDGREIFRAETSAANLDGMETAARIVAHSLFWRQPIPGVEDSNMVAQSPDYETPSPTENPAGYPNAIGFKGALAIPVSGGRSFSPLMGLQFDARMGPRNYFIEFGAGVQVPTDNQYGTGSVRATFLFADLGAGFYLSQGSAALYLAGGISPGIWNSEIDLDTSRTSAVCSLHGQLGVTFTRDTRARIFLEVQVSQFILGVVDPDSSYGAISGSAYHPALLALQGGVGF